MRQGARYILSSSDSGTSAEIYFPKRAAYQGAIFDAVRNGFYEQPVKDYLTLNAAELIEELRDWGQILDPLKYASEKPLFRSLSAQDVVARVQMYKSVFKGYSMYTVDGVFFSDKTQTIHEEAIQVLRLMFRFESRLEAEAKQRNCKDMLRSLSRWLIDYDIRLNCHYSWAPSEKERFLAEHRHWPESQLAFAEQHFDAVAREVEKWTDDCGLFVFGYLVRKFSKNVLVQKMSEEEIWVVSSYDPCLNVVRRVGQS
ncbi:MAG TPA: hypothetical protein VEL76_30400 [Gemmataceae bacterium]|nr:hypothetical protein [Gemmataceae bacterium]